MEDEEVQSLQRQLKKAVSSRSGDLSIEASLCNQLAVRYQSLGHWRNAALFHQHDLQISVALDDCQGVALAAINLSLVHRHHRSFTTARRVLEDDVVSKSCLRRGNRDVQAAVDVYSQLGRLVVDECRFLAGESLELINRHGGSMVMRTVSQRRIWDSSWLAFFFADKVTVEQSGDGASLLRRRFADQADQWFDKAKEALAAYRQLVDSGLVLASKAESVIESVEKSLAMNEVYKLMANGADGCIRALDLVLEMLEDERFEEFCFQLWQLGAECAHVLGRHDQAVEVFLDSMLQACRQTDEDEDDDEAEASETRISVLMQLAQCYCLMGDLELARSTMYLCAELVKSHEDLAVEFKEESFHSTTNLVQFLLELILKAERNEERFEALKDRSDRLLTRAQLAYRLMRFDQCLELVEAAESAEMGVSEQMHMMAAESAMYCEEWAMAARHASKVKRIDRDGGSFASRVLYVLAMMRLTVADAVVEWKTLLMGEDDGQESLTFVEGVVLRVLNSRLLNVDQDEDVSLACLLQMHQRDVAMGEQLESFLKQHDYFANRKASKAAMSLVGNQINLCSRRKTQAKIGVTFDRNVRSTESLVSSSISSSSSSRLQSGAKRWKRQNVVDLTAIGDFDDSVDNDDCFIETQIQSAGDAPAPESRQVTFGDGQEEEEESNASKCHLASSFMTPMRVTVKVGEDGGTHVITIVETGTATPLTMHWLMSDVARRAAKEDRLGVRRIPIIDGLFVDDHSNAAQFHGQDLVRNALVDGSFIFARVSEWIVDMDFISLYQLLLPKSNVDWIHCEEDGSMVVSVDASMSMAGQEEMGTLMKALGMYQRISRLDLSNTINSYALPRLMNLRVLDLSHSNPSMVMSCSSLSSDRSPPFPKLECLDLSFVHVERLFPLIEFVLGRREDARLTSLVELKLSGVQCADLDRVLQCMSGAKVVFPQLRRLSLRYHSCLRVAALVRSLEHLQVLDCCGSSLQDCDEVVLALETVSTAGFRLMAPGALELHHSSKVQTSLS